MTHQMICNQNIFYVKGNKVDRTTAATITVSHQFKYFIRLRFVCA